MAFGIAVKEDTKWRVIGNNEEPGEPLFLFEDSLPEVLKKALMHYGEGNVLLFEYVPYTAQISLVLGEQAKEIENEFVDNR